MKKVTIELTEEEYGVLKELQEDIKKDYAEEKYQENPYIMRIKSTQEEVTGDGFEDGFVLTHDGELTYHSEEIWGINEDNLDEFLEENEIDKKDFEKFVENCWETGLSLQVKDYLIEEEDCEEVLVRHVEKFDRYYVGITRSFAKEYVKNASHKIEGEDPYTYATGMNWELKRVINTFLKIKF